MKFDEHLAAFLYENKSLKLEGIGTFTLDGKVSINHESEKEVYYPIEGLSFNFNPKSSTDDQLITFLVTRLGKIQPLVRSDLESYLSNIKQFVNIGKPYTIEGVGTLSKNNNGIYEFTPGNFLPVKEELHPKRENEEHNYPVRNDSSAGKIIAVVLIVVAALAALGGIGWGLASLFSKKQQEVVVADTAQQGMIDTLMQPATDTANILPQQSAASTDTNAGLDTSATALGGNSSPDSANYKMIFEVTEKKPRANRRTYQLHLLHSNTKFDSLQMGDKVAYRLYLPMKVKVADTTHIKDSLRIFFGGTITAERQ